jgi:hypothetical protein
VLLYAERTLSYYKMKDARTMFDEVGAARFDRLPLGPARRSLLCVCVCPVPLKVVGPNAQMDADNSGKLDADEVAALCKKMGKKLNDKGLQAAMADMDEDGSGEVRRTRPDVQRAG